ncbi:MAG: hypothetical protein IH987_19070 [Planctomycetes bacterium]|nr:hypothetical protein [Planctomycetota bacterium]
MKSADKSLPLTEKKGFGTAFVSAAGSEKEVNTVNIPPYYVIIGRGFSAIVNHSTLLQSEWGKKRLGGCEVVYLGFPDPWQGYVTHNMNQDAMLLIHPGFLNPNEGHRNIEDFLTDWLPSNEFAGITKNEVAEIKRKKDPGLRPGFVTKVTEESGDTGLYEIEYYDEESIAQWHDTVRDRIQSREDLGSIEATTLPRKKMRAKYVDICSGPGLAKVVDIGFPKQGGYEILMEPHLVLEYLKLSPNKQRIFAGSDYVRSFTKVPGGTRVCIQGLNTPAGVQAMERAFGLDSSDGDAEHVFGFASAGLETAFPPGGRLDGLAGFAQGESLPPRAKFPDQKVLYPGADLRGKKVVFGHGYRISEIKEIKRADVDAFAGLLNDDVGALLVRFRASGKMNPIVNTFSEATEQGPKDEVLFEYGVFDQVVICAGQQIGQDEPGSPLAIIKDLSNNFEDLKIIDRFVGADYPHPMGLWMGGTNPDPKIRVLGGAAHGSRIMAKNFNDKLQRLKDYELTLPMQAFVVQRGVTLAAVTIAQANHYFNSGYRSRNVNTGEYADLSEVCSSESADIEIVRGKSRNGFANADELALALAYLLKYSATVETDDFFFYRHEKKLCIGGGVGNQGELIKCVEEKDRVVFLREVKKSKVALTDAIFRYDPGDYDTTYENRYKGV